MGEVDRTAKYSFKNIRPRSDTQNIYISTFLDAQQSKYVELVSWTSNPELWLFADGQSQRLTPNTKRF